MGRWYQWIATPFQNPVDVGRAFPHRARARSPRSVQYLLEFGRLALRDFSGVRESA